MKNILIAVLGLTLFVGAANVYACGNKDGAEAHGSAAGMAGKTPSSGSCEVSGACQAATPSAQKTDGEATTRTSEFRQDYEHKPSMIKIPQVADKGAAPAKQPLLAQSNQAKNNKAGNLRAQSPIFTVLIGPLDIKSFLQM